MFRTLPLIALLALVPAPALAQKAASAKKPTATKPAKPRPGLAAVVADATGEAPAKGGPGDRAEKDGFGILQVSAPDARQFVGAWALGTASKATATSTVANKPLFVFIIFHGCKPAPDGTCDVVADFAIHRPDGSVDDDHKAMAIWKKAPADDPKKSVLGDGALGFGTDDEGPFGEYRIVATVTDRVAGITLQTAQTLTVRREGGAAAAPATSDPTPAASADAPATEPTPAPATTPATKPPRGR